MLLSQIEKLIRYATNSGASPSDLCKFLSVEILDSIEVSAIYALELKNNGYFEPIATFGVTTQDLPGWGNVSISVESPYLEATKKDKHLFFTKKELVEKYTGIEQYLEPPQIWESLLVCPFLPHGLTALYLRTTPQVDHEMALLLRAAGLIMLQHYNCCQHKPRNNKYPHRAKDSKNPLMLSERQLAIKNLIARGLSNPEIAQEIGYSESLVRQESMAIYSILNVSGRKELIDREPT